MKIMVLEESEDEGEANIMESTAEEDEEQEVDGECRIMNLSVDQVQPQTMKLEGAVQGVPILILVDSGATHNFISIKLVEAMGWHVESTRKMRIRLGDGHKAVAQGECKQVQIEIEGIKLSVDTLLFDLKGIDIVLGISWLASLGEMLVDWGKQIMKFQHNKEWVVLQGRNKRNMNQLALQSLLGKPKQRVNEWLFSTELNMQEVGEIAGTTEKLTDAQAHQLEVLLNR